MFSIQHDGIELSNFGHTLASGGVSVRVRVEISTLGVNVFESYNRANSDIFEPNQIVSIS